MSNILNLIFLVTQTEKTEFDQIPLSTAGPDVTTDIIITIEKADHTSLQLQLSCNW